MREITIRTSTSENRRRRNLWMTELINERGLVARAQKRYAYFVTEKREPVTKEDLNGWIESQSKLKQKKPRHISIRRTFDKETGVGQTVYRTTGSFYVLRDFKVFIVVFLHSIKFDILSSPTSKQQA